MSAYKLIRERPPKLLHIDDIRCDLHNHTTWSDGTASVLDMAKAAKAHGLKWIAICDHTKGQPKGLRSTADIKKQKTEIKKAEKKVGIRILHGTEMNIGAKPGTYDWTDEQMNMFDVVIASIHSVHAKDVTSRLLKAAAHPGIDIIGHVTGRMFGSRPIPEADWESIFKTAAQYGKLIEINAQPSRMDPPPDFVRMAKKAGCRFVINTDSHSVRQFAHMPLGVSIARRAGLTRRDILRKTKELT